MGSSRARRGCRRACCYSGGNRKAAVGVVLMLAGSPHGQGQGEIMGWSKLAVLSMSWRLPPTHRAPPLRPSVRGSATCPVDRKTNEAMGKKEAIDKNTERDAPAVSVVNVRISGA